MKKQFIIPLLLLLGVCIFDYNTQAQSADQDSKVYEWKIQHDAPRGDVLTEHLIHFSKDVENRSKGRLKIQVFADPEIVPGFELLQAVIRGAVQMASTSGLFEAGQVPLSAVEFGLPLMYSFPEFKGDFAKEANAVREFFYDKDMVGLLRKQYGKFGVYWLDMFTYGPDTLFSKKPIKSIEDLKGMKMATIPQMKSWIEMMGASYAELAGGDLFMGLKLGTVDAGTWDINGITALGFHEVGQNVAIGYSNDQTIGHLLVNMKAWNSLPDELKQVLQNAAKDWFDYRVKSVAGIVNKAKEMGEKGEFKLMQFDDNLQAIAKEKAKKVWDEWAKRDAACAKAVALQKEWYKNR
jgi:TRAP-type mannitol/chloroaromatic compound transport system substrate-binding protein